MRFLVDNALSPRLVTELQTAGHDAVHVLSLGMEDSSDRDIIMFAAAEDRVVITAEPGSRTGHRPAASEACGWIAG